MQTPPCRYGGNCYRVNPAHAAMYSHPPGWDPNTAPRVRWQAPRAPTGFTFGLSVKTKPAKRKRERGQLIKETEKIAALNSREYAAADRYDGSCVTRDKHGHVLRGDLEKLEDLGREWMTKLLNVATVTDRSGTSRSVHVLRLKQFRAFIAQHGGNTPLLRTTLTAMPFSVLDPLSRHLPIDGIADRAWERVITPELLNECMKRAEFGVRKGRLRTSSPKSGPDPIGWVPVFAKDGRLHASFTRRGLTEEERQHAHCDSLPDDYVRVIEEGNPSLVSSLEEFTLNLEAFAMLKIETLGLGPKQLLMGGAVLACLRKPPPEMQGLYNTYKFYANIMSNVLPKALAKHVRSFLSDLIREEAKTFVSFMAGHYMADCPTSDLDIFMSAKSEQSAKQAIAKTVERLGDANDDAAAYFVRTLTAITSVGVRSQRNVQFIPVLDRRPVDLLMDFDLDCATFAYDGEQVWALPRGRRAVNTGFNFVDPFVIRYARNRSRLAKYDRRGFGMLLYEACRHAPRCDVILDDETMGWWKLCMRSVKHAQIKRELGKADEPKTKIKTTELEHNKEKELLDTALMTGDGFVYNEGPIPTFAETPETVHERMLLLERLEKKRHDATVGPGTKYMKRFASGWELPELYFVPLRQRSRPAIGRNPERIQWQCYMCGGDVDGEFRDRLCSGCALTNKVARDKTADLAGKVALITGARIKVGYACAVKLLRCGATVVGTTRFPEIAKAKYAAEPDSARWLHRLHVVAMDLRSIPSLLQFLRDFKRRFKRIDIIINNAAQTIRRPPAYYQSLLTQEKTLRLTSSSKPLTTPSQLETLAPSGGLLGLLSSAPMRVDMSPVVTAPAQDTTMDLDPASSSSQSSSSSSSSSSSDVTMALGETAVKSTEKEEEVDDLVVVKADSSWAAEATQICVLPEDSRDSTAMFPVQRHDPHGEPLDLRPNTSWNASFAQVNPMEMMEVQLVNVTAPFLIVSELQPLLRMKERELKSGDVGRRFVINVSSSEGQFHTPLPKKSVHPHTNMAKASLNMFTRTIAAELARDLVFVLSVDTGWVSDMRPFAPVHRTEKSSAASTSASSSDSPPQSATASKPTVKEIEDEVLLNPRAGGMPLRPPLSVEDGAARVLQPILDHVQITSPLPAFGVFLKNFKIEPW